MSDVLREHIEALAALRCRCVAEWTDPRDAYRPDLTVYTEACNDVRAAACPERANHAYPVVTPRQSK